MDFRSTTLDGKGLQAVSPDVSDPVARAHALAELFDLSAPDRDRAGGTPKVERDLLRESGLLRLSIPVAYGGLGGDWTTVMKTVRKMLASASIPTSPADA